MPVNLPKVDVNALYIGIQPYKLGRNSYVSEFSHIAQYTEIGSFCSIGNLCTIGAQNHQVSYLTTFPFEELVSLTPPQVTVLGNDVWVGSSVIVIAGVKVGHGAVIGAGSVVTKDVPPYAIVYGSPARVIRYRFPPEVIAGLLESAWWDLPLEVIKKLPITDPVRCLEEIRALTLANSSQ